MISAGQDARGVSPYGGGYSRPRTKEELDEQLKKSREKLDEMLKKKIAEFKEADPFFKKRLCPIVGRDNDGEYITNFSELCRDAKDKLDKLLPHKPEPSIAAAIRKEVLREVPKEEFMTYVQRYYLSRYLMNFKTRSNVKEILEKLKKDPNDAQLKRKYKVAYWTFVRKYNKALRAYLKKSYVMMDGKIYQVPGNPKKIKAKGATTANPDMQCFDRSNGSLEIYQDCTCAVNGGGTECEWLQDDSFTKKTGKPDSGKIRARIYFNPSSKELRLIPEGDSYAPPKDFKPISLGSLKWFLSRHKDASEGGKKLLLDFLQIDSLKAKDGSTTIFRNEDNHYVTDVDSVDFLSKFSVYNEAMHKARTYPAGIYLNEAEAKEFIAKVNGDKEILDLTRGMPPFNPTNFARTPTKQYELWEYVIPKDPALLLKVFNLVDKMKKGKAKTTIPKATLLSMHTRLHHLVKADIRANFMFEMQKWQKAMGESQNFWQKVGLFSQFLFIGIIVWSTWRQMRMAKRQEKYMRLSMMQALDPARAKKEMREEQEKIDAEARDKEIKKLEKKKLKSDKRVKRGKEATITPAESRRLTSLKKAREKEIRESSMEYWERTILNLTVKDKKMKGELVEYAIGLLRERPNEPIPGRDNEAWQVLESRASTGEESSPFVYGVSGSGKRYVHQAASEKIAMAYLYENDRAEIERRLHAIYQERYDANPEFFNNDLSAVQREVDHYMVKYKEASENLNPALRDHRFYLIHNAKLQAGTTFRGAQADKVLECFAANEHNATPVFQEFATILMAGATSGGGGEEADTSESVLELTKQHIEGTSDDGEEVEVDKEGKEKKAGETSNGINADTTPHRALKVKTDGRSEDLSRRFKWIANNAWSPQEALEYVQAPRIYGPLERKFNVRLSPEALEAAVRIGVQYECKPGRLPLTAANSVLKGAAGYVTKAEKKNGWDGRTPIVITAEHMFDYAESRYKVKIKNRNLAEFGKLKMKQPREYFMFKRDVRAMKELKSGTVTILSSNRADTELVNRHIKANEPGIVRKIATTLDLDAIGDFEDVEHYPRKAEEAARVAVIFARRLHKLGGDDIPRNTNDLQLWIEQNLDNVMPVSDEVVERAETVLQEEILRVMDPTSKKYEANTSEERNERMLKDAKSLETELLAYANDPNGEKTLYELIQNIPTVVTAYETDQPLVPAAATDGVRRISEAMLARYGFKEGSVEYYLATKHMDADKFGSDAEIVAVARNAAARVVTHLGEGDLHAEDVDKHAEIAIGEATLEVRSPDDPDKDPRGPKGGPKGGARGPGGAPKPAAPRDVEPRSPSDRDPSARARLASQIETMLPESLKPYAKHVAVVCERKPELMKLNSTTQRALFTALANKAMQRHPEVIGGSRKGVVAAKARRRSRRDGREIDGKERRAEELRSIEHLRRLVEMRRLREARRRTK